MSENDRRVIGEALLAVTRGPFVPDDGEFAVITGASRTEVAAAAERWPMVDDEVVTWIFVRRGVSHLLGFPHGRDDVWDQYLSMSCDELGLLARRVNAAGRRDSHLQQLLDDRREAWFSGLGDDEVADYLRMWERSAHPERLNARFRKRIVEEADRRGLRVPPAAELPPP